MQKEEKHNIHSTVRILDEEVKRKKAFKISIKEGSAMSFGSDLGNSLITPLATEIGGNSIHIGLISALSGLFSPLVQIKGDRLMESMSRKKIVARFILLQAIMWLPIALLGLLYSKNILTDSLPWLLIAFYTVLAIAGSFTAPSWFSWLGDLVNEKERGKFFAKRNVYIGISGIIGLLFGGFILKYFKANNSIFMGFLILFSTSFLFTIIANYYIKRQYEPKFKLDKKSYFSFFSFIKRFDNYGKFSVYQSFFNLAIMIASPFFALYMLENLGFKNNYMLYMIVSLTSTFFYLLFTPLAGKFSDKYGNLKLLWISNIFFAITPLLWIFVKSPLQIIFLPQLSAGIANAALAIAVTNYTYGSASKEHRGLCIAYTNILIGVGAFFGSIIGGFLIRNITLNAFNSFIFVFIIAAIARILVALVFLPRLKEVKRVSKLRLHFPIHLSLTRPFRFLHLEHSILGFLHPKAAKIKFIP